MTVNEYGKGRVYYVGCDLDNDAMKELVRIIAKSANVEQLIHRTVWRLLSEMTAQLF